MNKLEYKEEIFKQINSFVSQYIKFNQIDDFMRSYKFYPINAHYSEMLFDKEKINKEVVPVKMAIINDIQYVNNFNDDDINIIRLFTLTTPTEIQYFTSTGSRNYFGEPKEHTRNEFLYLLDNHPDLKNNDVIKHMKSVILHNELQEDLSIQNTKTKKQKL
jgi:hypothetical protein